MAHRGSIRIMSDDDDELQEADGWAPPAMALRVMYDDEGRVQSMVAEYLEVPAAEELARLVAQFLTIRPGQLPSRVPGANLPRDPRLDRQFRAVLGVCGATASIPDPQIEGHDTHFCLVIAADHGRSPHLCECGATFGG